MPARRIFTSAAVGNIDNDSWLELVVAAGDSVRCWELCSSAATPSMTSGGRCSGTTARGPDATAFACRRTSRNRRRRARGERCIRSIYPNPFNPLDEDRLRPRRQGARQSSRSMTLRGGEWRCSSIGSSRPGGTTFSGTERRREGATAASGVYFCVLRAGSVSETKKMVLIR